MDTGFDWSTSTVYVVVTTKRHLRTAGCQRQRLQCASTKYQDRRGCYKGGCNDHCSQLPPCRSDQTPCCAKTDNALTSSLCIARSMARKVLDSNTAWEKSERLEERMRWNVM